VKQKTTSKMANIRSGFSKFSFSGLLELLNNVIEKLTLNATTFPDPPIALATLTTLATAFSASISKAIKGSEAARAARNAKMDQVKAALLATAEYVRMVSGGSAELLSLSGFELMKQRQPVGQVGTPLMRSAKVTGLEGELELIWSKVPGAYSYQGFQTESDPAAPGTVWVQVLTTTRVRFKIHGLTPYKAYWFAVQALGTDGPGAISDPILGRAS
jgi:hypothetical protein